MMQSWTPEIEQGHINTKVIEILTEVVSSKLTVVAEIESSKYVPKEWAKLSTSRTL